MTLAITASFAFHAFPDTDLLLQFEAATMPGQHVDSAETRLPTASQLRRVRGAESIGERIWLRAEGDCQVDYRATVTVDRPAIDLGLLAQAELCSLPGEVVKYLFDSRYCQVDPMHAFVDEHFGNLHGGARVLAMRDWIAEHFEYVPGASNSHTTALDSYVERRGICRDYAHVLITFARACAIPARYASCFAPGVAPQDFHAVAEVWLADPARQGAGAWHLVDATGMADSASSAIIGVGRDAADVSFMTSFGATNFAWSKVDVAFA